MSYALIIVRIWVSLTLPAPMPEEPCNPVDPADIVQCQDPNGVDQ